MVIDVKDKADLKRALVICPPSAAASPWMRRFGDAQTAFASGWMQLRGARRRGGYDRGFVLSDHADWPGLMGAIAATGAQRIIVTHGSVPVMVRYLGEQGLQAEAFDTEYGDDRVEADVEAPDLDMKRFSRLFAELDATTSTNAKVEALQRYFEQAPAAGRRLGRLLPVRRQAAAGGFHGKPRAAGLRGRADIRPGCSTSATRPSATWPKPSPTSCRAKANPRMWAWRTGSRSGCCRCAA